MVAMAVLLLSASTIISANPILQSAYADSGLDFKKIKNLSKNDATSFGPQITVSGKNVYVVWPDNTPVLPDIFFKRSTDGGKTFGKTINLSNSPIESFIPRIAVSGKNVYVVWQEGLLEGPSDVSFKRSTDGGKTFGKTINLSDNPKSSTNFPEISVSGKNVYVVWDDDTPGNFDIFFRRSTDGGKTFGKTINLSNNDGNSEIPRIAVSGRNVYVVWKDFTLGLEDIFFKRSTNKGDDFGKTINLSNNPEATSERPRIAVSGRNVYVVWQDDTQGNGDIFFRRSTDGGKTFEKTKNLSNNAEGSLVPQIVASGRNVYVVWEDFTPGNIDIFFRRSTDRGDDFDKTINLSNNDGFSFDVQIAISGRNNVYVVWDDDTPAGGDFIPDIFFRSTDKGDDFDKTINLSNNDGFSGSPQIAVSGRNVYVVWQDDTQGIENNNPDNFDIFFRRGISR
jgi:hypothetical protein